MTRAPAKPKTVRVKGEDVRRQVEAYLRLRGITFDRRNTGAFQALNRDGSTRTVRCGVRGDADIAGVLFDGRAFAIEAKATDEKPTSEQLARLHRINASRGVAFWVDDVATVMAVLDHVLAGASIEENGDRRGPIVNCLPGCTACQATEESASCSS